MAAALPGAARGTYSTDDIGGFMATVLDMVRGLIERLSPEPVCDDCITERLRLSATSAANKQTRELAGSGGFERLQHVCSLCGAPRKVIRRRAA